jgi:hypothetical protein
MLLKMNLSTLDHPLGPGKVFVIHAKGQKQGAYSHVAPSALEKNQVTKREFYKNDQWRYHGSEFLLFSIVIENSGLAAVHNNSVPRAYKGLIARGYLGFFWYAVLVGF